MSSYKNPWICCMGLRMLLYNEAVAVSGDLQVFGYGRPELSGGEPVAGSYSMDYCPKCGKSLKEEDPHETNV